ncbi:hypothetical protein ACFV00_15270 [Streptomyces californicus]|uniref:hypothetical protein n=1 Tax=Streptomyces californicus TaxID=67351 RepID=UPI003692F212
MTDTAPMDGQTTVELPELDPVQVPAPDAPPKRTRRKSAATAADTKPRQPRGAARQPKLETRIGTNLATLGMTVGVFNQADGMAIMAGAPAFAEALAGLADESPKARELMEGALSGGAMLKCITAGAGILLPILANHGLIPSGILAAAGPPQEAPGAPA